jgi:hypothetical protein
MPVGFHDLMMLYLMEGVVSLQPGSQQSEWSGVTELSY